LDSKSICLDLEFQYIEFKYDVPELCYDLFYQILALYFDDKCIIHKCKALKKWTQDDIDNIYLIDIYNSKYLLKIRKNINNNNVLLLENLMKYLDKQNVNILCPIPNYKNQYYTFINNSNYVVEISHLIAAEYYNNDLEQLKLIAMEISRLHSCLKKYPYYKDIQENTTNNEYRLYNSFEMIKNNYYIKTNDNKIGYWIMLNKQYIGRLISDYQSVQNLNYDVQVIHGDLNKGNILVLRDPLKILIIDFEDAIFSYLPVAFEICFFIQRFILCKTLKNLSYKELYIFINNYQNIDCVNSNYLYEIPYILRLLSYRSTLKLIAAYKDYGFFDKPEMDKFVKLELQALEFEKIKFFQ